MNFSKLIDELAKLDTGSESRQTSDRRDALRKMATRLAATMVPLTLGATLNKASARTTSTTTVAGSLNYLLELEYFKYNFFHTANSTDSATGVIPVADQPGFVNIAAHNLAHITALSNAVTAAGGTPYLPNNYNNNPFCPAAYDFTAGGLYPVFYSSNYSLFLDFAQLFQDLCSRAYIDTIANLEGDKANLTLAMQILTVESRHAAHIRLVRRLSVQAPDYPKPWVTMTNSVYSTPPNEFRAYYVGEDNYWQAGLDVSTFAGVTGTISENAATEAFDEPMDQTTVLGLLAQFMLP
jgi:Ferritin-like domain